MAQTQMLRLNLQALLDVKKETVDQHGSPKSQESFIALHLAEVQAEQAPNEGCTVVVTPRSRTASDGSVRNTPRDRSAPTTPRSPNSAKLPNIDRLHSCTECGTYGRLDSPKLG